MKRLAAAVFAFALAAAPANTHFVWIVPENPLGTKAKIVFSDDLDQDEGVSIDKIAHTKLLVRDQAGKESPLPWKKLDHAFQIDLTGQGELTIGGVCKYGVLQKGSGEPFLLNYYAKFVRGPITAAKPWGKLPFEIVASGTETFRVLFDGEPVAEAEIVIAAPAAAKGTLKADKQGEFKLSCSAAGLYALRAKFVEEKAGEQDGKKFAEARHYATLVFRVVTGVKTGAAPAFPALPRAVSSFGAAVEDGWVYVYGGHCAKTHVYSTEAVVGTFHRLKLANPKSWETLPGGPGLQGLGLVSHRGKIYRIGGMQPHNKPGDKADNHSTATCARFDPAAKKWKAIPDMPEPRSSHDAVVIGDKLFVVGGWTLNGAGKKSVWHASMLVMDLAQKKLTWHKAEQPFQRRALTAAVHDGKMYVVAGIGPDGIEPVINIYDPAKKAWTTGPNLPGPRRNGFSPAAISTGGTLYANGSDGKVYALTAKGAAWQEVGQVKQSRIVHRMVAVSPTMLLVVGGAAKGDNVSESEAVSLSSDLSTRPRSE